MTIYSRLVGGSGIESAAGWSEIKPTDRSVDRTTTGTSEDTDNGILLHVERKLELRDGG